MNILRKKLNSGVVIFDGAMGTELYKRNFFVNNSYEQLNVTRPAVISEIHRAYLSAGAEVLTANTFVKRTKVCISSAAKLRKTIFTAISANKYSPTAHGNATAAVTNRENRMRLRTSFLCPAADEAEMTGTLAAAIP